LLVNLGVMLLQVRKDNRDNTKETEIFRYLNSQPSYYNSPPLPHSTASCFSYFFYSSLYNCWAYIYFDMKFFQTTILFFASSALVSAISIQKRGVDPSLVPQFGLEPGQNPTGTGDCDGIVSKTTGQPVKVPCACPPPRDTFIAVSKSLPNLIA